MAVLLSQQPVPDWPTCVLLPCGMLNNSNCLPQLIALLNFFPSDNAGHN